MAQKRITTPASENLLPVEPAAVSHGMNPGDLVRIVVREQTPGDIKSQLYYPHMAGLAGRILKIYGEEASVQIERAGLSDAVGMRHDEIEAGMRQKWLDGLSEDARGKLGEKEKEFRLAYTLLVSLKDLEKRAPGDPLNLPPAAPEIVSATASEKAAAREAAKEAGEAALSVDPLTGESDVAAP